MCLWYKNKVIASLEGKALIELYTISGQLIHNETATEKFEYPVSSGIYLIRVNGKTNKVLVP